MTIKEVKKELGLTDADIAEFFKYANDVSYRNSARKEKLDSGIIKMFLKCQEHFLDVELRIMNTDSKKNETEQCTIPSAVCSYSTIL